MVSTKYNSKLKKTWGIKKEAFMMQTFSSEISQGKSVILPCEEHNEHHSGQRCTAYNTQTGNRTFNTFFFDDTRQPRGKQAPPRQQTIDDETRKVSTNFPREFPQLANQKPQPIARSNRRGNSPIPPLNTTPGY